MNEFADAGPFSFQEKHDVDTTLDARVGIVPHANDHGSATIVADIGAPVLRRVKIAVRDEVAIGFGCDRFIRDGPSVRIVDGVPRPASLVDSDIAVLGPAGSGPGYGCWGANLDLASTTYRLIFNHGGRVADGVEGPFIKQFPIDSVGGSPLDVVSGEGRQYRLHITLGGGTYFTGWIEPAAHGP